ncbi:hypothetical protein [Microbacterium lacticum]
MQPDAHRSRRRTLILAIAAALALLLLVGVGIYGLLRGPAHHADTRPVTSETTRHPSDLTFSPRQIPATGDAEQFARATAEALFTWDAAGDAGLTDYMQPLIDRADPEDAPALAADARTYFPDEAAWAQLRPLQVQQRIEIESVRIPDAWATAQAQARPGELPPGAIAYTITGTRHRVGTWGSTPAADSRPVSFTIFLACPPDESCRLLRLSGVDTPLH